MTAPPLVEVLQEAKQLGFLGPGPVEAHVAHAEGFLAAAGVAPRRFLDLGSGGGVPGLVLAARWPHATAVLLDGGSRRADFLRRAVIRLGWTDRIEVIGARAEVAGRDLHWRATFDVVTARSFGPPALTAECAAPFLAEGGVLLVSDPPGPEDRWPAAGVRVLGLAPDGAEGSVRRLRQATSCPGEYPRRRPGRPPLF